MADIGVKIEAFGFEGIEKEVKLILNAKVGREISNAVYSELKNTLEQHIKDDVYREYSPKEYIRRSENPSMGISLYQAVSEEQYTHQIGPFDYSSMEWVAGISYEPTGQHENILWSDLSGDELIRRIETKRPPYNWEPRKPPLIPKRPFWHRFVKEMIEGGRFAEVIERELKERGIMEPGDRVTGVTRQSGDGNY